MRKKLAKRKKEVNIPTKNVLGILTANLIGTICAVIFTLLCSLLLQKAEILSGSLTVYFVVCITLGALINGFVAAKRCSIKGIFSGIISSLPYALIITVIMLFFSKGILNTNTIFLYLAVIIGSTVGGIFSANTKRRR